jgi:predicted chitinase
MKALTKQGKDKLVYLINRKEKLKKSECYQNIQNFDKKILTLPQSIKNLRFSYEHWNTSEREKDRWLGVGRGRLGVDGRAAGSGSRVFLGRRQKG